MRITDLLAVLAKRYKEKIGQPPNKTKLIKLAYLAELYYTRITGERLTEQVWTYWKYGPYFFDYEITIEDELVFIKPEKWGDFYPIEVREDYEPGKPTLEESTALFRALDHAAEDLNHILDFIYFETEPMINVAHRGEILNFDSVLPQEFYVIKRLYVSEGEGRRIKERIHKWEKEKAVGH